MTPLLALLHAVVPAAEAVGEPQVEALIPYEEAKARLDSGKVDDEVQARIFDYFMKQAESGDRNAQYVIGTRYESGLGREKDPDKAREWYTKAAEQGHALAREKLYKHNPATERPAASPGKMAVVVADVGPAQAGTVKKKMTIATGPREEQIRANRPSATAVVSTPAPAARPEPVVALRPEPVEVTPIDAMGTVMRARWSAGGVAAEILPSDLTDCLQASEAEIVCFSEKITHKTGDAAVTYIVKSTLSDFTRDGGFAVSYVLNVLRLQGAPEEGLVLPAGNGGLALKPGWQSAGVALRCKVGGEKTLACSEKGKNPIRFAAY